MVGLTQSPAATSMAPAGFWGRVVAKVRSWFEIPYGYEDDKGFHYGTEPVPAKPCAPVNAPQTVFTDRATDVIPSHCPVPLNDTETADDDHRHIV